MCEDLDSGMRLACSFILVAEEEGGGGGGGGEMLRVSKTLSKPATPQWLSSRLLTLKVPDSCRLCGSI